MEGYLQQLSLKYFYYLDPEITPVLGSSMPFFSDFCYISSVHNKESLAHQGYQYLTL